MSAPFRLNRALIEVSGPDARSFLNNLLTQSLDQLNETGVAYAALLTPQGKILADMLVWENGATVVIEADAARAEELLRRLTMYKLRAQVTIKADEARSVLWSARLFEGARADPRLADLGYRRLTEDRDAQTGDDAYDAHRLALGAPDLARDAAPDEVFALEALLEELKGVDFKKGCFIGQENVSRMKRRATTRKKFCPIVFEGEAIAYGAPVLAGEAEIGSVRTGAAGRAIALLRLDRALEAIDAGTPLTAGGRNVRLDPPPWLILPGREQG
jgi:folate-binding protein YgfZ